MAEDDGVAATAADACDEFATDEVEDDGAVVSGVAVDDVDPPVDPAEPAVELAAVLAVRLTAWVVAPR